LESLWTQHDLCNTVMVHPRESQGSVRMAFYSTPERFWTEITQIEGSATPYVLRRTLVFGIIALVVTVTETLTTSFAVPVTPYEILGAALGAVLVLRTNAGYERWW